MKSILYLHGFAGSGSSGTATSLRNALYEHGVEVIAPDIPVMPAEAMAFLRQQVADLQPDLIVATSMGAMYAEQLRGHLRILVNPSFCMARLLTFGGMGRKPFRNPRQDGAKDFKVDKDMIAQFKEVERHSFEGITPATSSTDFSATTTSASTANPSSRKPTAPPISLPSTANTTSTMPYSSAPFCPLSNNF